MPVKLDGGLGVSETIHGVVVHDPYRWLEDRASGETEGWITEQRGSFEEYLRKLGPLAWLEKRVHEFLDVETVDEIGKVGERYFFRRRRTGEQQPSIVVMDEFDHAERVLVDGSVKGQFSAISIIRISADSNLLAYHVKEGGEHTRAIFVVDVYTGTTLPDHLSRGLARGFVFRTSSDGFYYCHEFVADHDILKKDHQVLFHRMGTAMTDDLVILTLPRKQSSKLVLLHDGESLGALYAHDLGGTLVVDLYVTDQNHDQTWNRVRHNEPAPFTAFFYQDKLYALRFHKTPNGELVELDRMTGEQDRVIVPEWHARIQQSIIVLDRFYVSYLENGKTFVHIWSIDGKPLGTLPLEDGYTWGLIPRYANEPNEFFLHCESFTAPPIVLHCDGDFERRTVWNRRQAPTSSSSFVARKHRYLSKDGTEVEVSIVGPPESDQIVNHPVIMTGYGGFGASSTPLFSPFVSVMLELGCLFVLPEIRGGGERGTSWHEAGKGRNRQRSFDDFIAAAEWLCAEGFTTPQKLAIFGGSNSGLLVGAAITQRPDLFRAALCIAPILDMVRYHLFDRAHVWSSEYGTADDPGDFAALLAYSPYHNVKDGLSYPSVLFVCGDKDTRCNPAHARKMAARLKDHPGQRFPIMVDHSSERGHAPTMPLSIRVEGITHRIAFLCHELGISIPLEAPDVPFGY